MKPTATPRKRLDHSLIVISSPRPPLGGLDRVATNIDIAIRRRGRRAIGIASGPLSICWRRRVTHRPRTEGRHGRVPRYISHQPPTPALRAFFWRQARFVVTALGDGGRGDRGTSLPVAACSHVLEAKPFLGPRVKRLHQTSSAPLSGWGSRPQDREIEIASWRPPPWTVRDAPTGGLRRAPSSTCRSPPPTAGEAPLKPLASPALFERSGPPEHHNPREWCFARREPGVCLGRRRN